MVMRLFIIFFAFFVWQSSGLAMGAIGIPFIPSDQLEVNHTKGAATHFGKGTFGHVFEGTYLGAPVAVKVFYLQTCPSELIAEFDVYRIIHPNLARVFGINNDPKKFRMVTERAISLDKYMQNEGNLYGWDFIHRGMLEMARGLQALHLNGTAHKHLKARNVLLSDTLTFKLADWGLGNFKLQAKSSGATQSEATVRWRAPETFTRVYARSKDTLALQAADIYSLGLVYWQLVTRVTPFKDQTEAQVVQLLIKEGGTQEQIDASWPQWFKDLLNDCWKKIPAERPTIGEIIKRLESAETKEALEILRAEDDTKILLVDYSIGKLEYEREDEKLVALAKKNGGIYTKKFIRKNAGKVARILNVDTGKYEDDIVQWAGDMIATPPAKLDKWVKAFKEIAKLYEKVKDLLSDEIFSHKITAPVEQRQGDLIPQVYGNSAETILAAIDKLELGQQAQARAQALTQAMNAGNDKVVDELIPHFSFEEIVKSLEALDGRSKGSLLVAKKIFAHTDEVPFSAVGWNLSKTAASSNSKNYPDKFEVLENKLAYFKFFVAIALGKYTGEKELPEKLGRVLGHAARDGQTAFVEHLMNEASALIPSEYIENAMKYARINHNKDTCDYLKKFTLPTTR